MKHRSMFFLPIVSLVALTDCRRTNDQAGMIRKNQDPDSTEKLIPIVLSDTLYSDLGAYIKDTITHDGWMIRYLTKDDNSKYDDVYIQCSKENLTGTFYGYDLLQMRYSFIPEFVGETELFIYFIHRCAPDCASLLVFSKNGTSQFRNFEDIVDYKREFNQVLYVTDDNNNSEDHLYSLTLVELAKDKTYNITFDALCKAVNKRSCVDKVVFNKEEVIIEVTLSLKQGDEMDSRQTRTIKL